MTDFVTNSHANTIAFVTLGCAKNEVDTAHMRARVLAAGFTEVLDPGAADFILINTCAFITAATEESLQAIFEAATLDNVVSGAAKLVVCGCLPARYTTELPQQLPEVAAFVNAADEDEIVAVLTRLGAQVAVEQRVEQRDGSCAPFTEAQEPSLCSTATVLPWAYVKISDGCSRNCSYCTIPAIRGPYHSFSFEQINSEIAALTHAGVKEIILIGQDTGIWRADEDPRKLHNLLGVLAKSYPTTWFRVMYLQPQGVTTALLDVMAAHPNICNYLDIPLQHANARIIKEMNRKGSGEKYLDLLGKIRTKLPDVALRTTLIAGFPGETRAEARELERFVKAAQFDFVGVFAYSQEDGTVAGERANQVPARTRTARAQRLRDAADSVGFSRAQALVGSKRQVLICGMDEEGLYGRTQGQAPEVDGVVYLSGFDAKSPAIGSMVTATITEAVCYDLFAEVDA